MRLLLAERTSWICGNQDYDREYPLEWVVERIRDPGAEAHFHISADHVLEQRRFMSDIGRIADLIVAADANFKHERFP